MRSCLFILFCFLFSSGHAQKQKHVTLSTEQRLAVLCYLMQPLQSDTSYHIYPDRYAPGLIYLRFRNNPNIQHYLVEKMTSVTELILKMILRDSLAAYSGIGLVLPDSGMNIERSLLIKNVLSDQKYLQYLKEEWNFEKKLQCLTSALPFISAARTSGKKKKDIYLYVYDSDKLIFPKDGLVCKAYAISLAIATYLILGTDIKEVESLTIEIPDPDGHLSTPMHFIFTINNIRDCIEQFNQFIL